MLKRSIKGWLIRLKLYGPIFRAREIVRGARGPIRPRRGPDGLPFPSSYLMILTVGNPHAQAFFESGISSLTGFAQIVGRNGGHFASFRRVLDFGCGCGRLARHLPRFTNAEIYGSDYNPRLVRWCRRNLPGHFSLNRLLPPLPFEQGFFDCVYAASVFTHLSEDTQFKWLVELRRVLRPGGYLVVSLHDETYLAEPELKQLLAKRGFLVRNNLLEGSNLLGAYHTAEYVKARFSQYFRLLEFVPGDGSSYVQALVLLRNDPEVRTGLTGSAEGRRESRDLIN